MNEIIEAPSSAVATTTPSALLAMAVQQGADLDKLERLMALQERWEANEARKAHAAAFSAFKADAVTIIKGTTIKDGPLKGKKHADLFDVVSAVTPGLSKHGLSVSWKLTKDEKDWLEVTCYLKHVGGHVEFVGMGGAPDSGPGRNAIQARGSTKTYLERYTALAILGMAASDADDDGDGGADDQAGKTHKKREPAERTVLMKVVHNIQDHLSNGRELGALQEYDLAWERGEEFVSSVWNSLTTPQRDEITRIQNANQKAPA